MATPTTTRAAIRVRAVETVHQDFPPIQLSASSNGTTTTIVDTDTPIFTQEYDLHNMWAYVASKPTAGPAIGEVARIASVSGNTITTGSAFSAATESAMSWELHPHFHPNKVHKAINETLGNMRHSLYLPLTVIADGDLEGADLTSFTEIGNTTWAKAAPTVPLRSRKIIKASAIDADTDYIRASPSPSIGYPRTCLVSQDLYTTNGSQQLTVHFMDGATATDIETGTTSHSGWSTIQFVATNTDETIRWEVTHTSTSGTYEVGPFILQPLDQRMWNLPTSFTWPEQFGGLVYIPPGAAWSNDDTADVTEYAYAPLDVAPIPIPSAEVSVLRYDDSTANWNIQIANCHARKPWPIYVFGRVPYTALADDTTTTTAPLDIVADLVAARLLEDWASEDDERGRTDIADKKRSRAQLIRARLQPRVDETIPVRGVLKGAG